jgi:hypothetical protein
MPKELDVVRVNRLAEPARHFTGAKDIARAPRVGDVGTIVTLYDPATFCVECVADGGTTVWLADFGADEVELVWTAPENGR